ncbi:hypothetical protein ACHAXT_000464 [Thalassiosira profunda]
MADLNRAGMVQSPEQIRNTRRSRGFCDTCRIEAEPVQCYEIKKRMLGRERVPLTRPGRVFNGTCLVCHPDRDPDGGRHQRRNRPSNHQHQHRHPHRGSQPDRYPQHSQGQDERFHPVPINSTGVPMPQYIDSGEAFRGDDWVRGSSLPSLGVGQQMMERRPDRQGGVRDLATSLPAEFQQQASMGHLQQGLEEEYYRDEQRHYRGDRANDEYVETTETNIFGEPVTVRRRVNPHRSRRRSQEAPGSPDGRNGARSPQNHPTNRRYGGLGTSPPGSPQQRSPGYPSNPAPQQRSPGHPSPRYPNEEKVEEQAPDDSFDYPVQAPPISGDAYQNGRGSPRADFGRHPRPYHQDSGRRQHEDIPTVPELSEENGNSGAATAGSRQQSTSEATDDESLDALALAVRRHCTQNQTTVPFVPGHTVHPNAELTLRPMDEDEMTALTLETCLRTTSTTMPSGQPSQRTQLSAISEAPSNASTGPQRSLASHEIREPAPAFDMEGHLESSAPELATLREVVQTLTQIGDDLMAIETITQALIHDNATSMSQELALFCLTTLWVMARKSDENKRTILLEGVTFDAIIEAMQIYRELSVEIQTRACGVLWSLSMDPKDRKHVAQGGGCDAILNAMLAYADNDELQVMAMGALKVISFDNIGKSTLRSRGARINVVDVMRRHGSNPTIQSEGCVIIGNLAVDETNHFVAPVSEGEVDVVVSSILAHPESLEVHEAACFTLMSLASSAANVQLIRRNGTSRLALELAFQQYPDEVGAGILTLLGRLGFGSPSEEQRG